MDKDTDFELAAIVRANRFASLASVNPNLLDAIQTVLRMDPKDAGFRAAVAKMDRLVEDTLKPIQPVNVVDDVMHKLAFARRSQPAKTNIVDDVMHKLAFGRRS
jgi:hypothetical protein